MLGSFAPSLLNFRGPMIAAMIAAGHEVLAAAPAIDPATAAGLRSLGAEPVEADLSNASLSPVDMYRSYRRLRALLAKLRPDLLLSYTIKPVIVGALAGRAAGVPQIVSLVSGLGLPFSDRPGLRHRLVRRAAEHLYRAAFARSDLVIFQNPDDPALLREAGVLRPSVRTVVVDGSGVDTERFAAAPPTDGASFVMISRLLRPKGVCEYAEAARRLRASHPNARASLAGYIDGTPASLDQAELDALIAGGLPFVGRLDDVRPVIADHAVFVLPSYYREGVPRSVLEAMAMGRAIVTTDTPGCRETVVDGVNGFLVPPRDADALYAAMARFAEDPGLAARMGARSRELAERRFDARKVSADILRHAGL